MNVHNIQDITQNIADMHFIVVLNLIKSHGTIIPSGMSYLSAVKCSVHKNITKVATIITIKPLTISCAVELVESAQVP